MQRRTRRKLKREIVLLSMKMESYRLASTPALRAACQQHQLLCSVSANDKYRSINSNLSDQANAMDISPANPTQKIKAKRSLPAMKRTELQKPPATFNKSFFSQLTSNQPRSLSSTSLNREGSNELLSPADARLRPTANYASNAATEGRSFGREVNPNLVKRERSQSETNLVFGKASGNTLLKKVLPRPGLRDATARLASASVGGNVLDLNPLGPSV